MSNNIDERIVEMRFDNKQFESGVKDSIKSIEDLKKGLKLEESAKSLSNLGKVGKSFSLAGIAEGVDNISKRFTALGIMGTTVLVNLANSAINAGMRISSALTIDPIKTGLEEYETKMNAITTILTNTASKGTTLEDVNKTLNELNTYSDQTIYNFAEMTRNIGTFTAAGVDLKTSAIAIKGIANLAAGSGSNAQQAATAMYQLSQAIAAGSVKLMDWNSVVNAGMGGELFQKALEKTAVELGHGRDMSVSFRESLEKGWITTDVLTKTLEKFANDKSLLKAATQVKTFTQLLNTMSESIQSGWAQTWETVIGNRDEAAAFFTAVNDGFSASAGAAANARNQMLAYWKANGGREAIIKSISNALVAMSSVLEPIEKAFRDIFPAMTGQRLVEISKAMANLTEKFKIGEETSKNLGRTFKGVFALVDIARQVIVAMANAFSSVIKYLMPASKGFLSFTGNIGDFIVSLDEALKKSNFFNVAIQKVGEIMKPFADGIRKAVDMIVNAFKSFGNVDMSGVDAFTQKVGHRFKPFTALIEGTSKVIAFVAPLLYKAGEIISNAFQRMTNGIAKAFSNADYKTAFDIINGGLFAGILLGLNKFIKSLSEITGNAGDFLGKVTGILDGIKGSLEAYQSQLKAGTLMKIAMSIGILAGSLFVLSMIDSKKLTTSMAAMTGMFIELFGAMTIFTKLMSGTGIKAMASVTVATTAMIGLSVAILILSAAMTRLAKIDWRGIVKGLTSVAALSGILVLVAKSLEGNSGGLIRASLGLILFAEAVNVLANAVEKLGKLDIRGLAKGLIGVGVLVGELALFMNYTDFSGMGLMKGLGLIAMAGAISILADAVKKFSELNIKGLIKGLGAVGVVLTELGLFVNLTGDSKRVISTAIGLTILAGAMNIFAVAIAKMGILPINQIGKGLIAMGGALMIVTTALNFMPKNMIGTSLALVAVAGSLVILSKALANMGGMSWTGIAKGLITLAGSLTIIATAMAFMTTALPGAAALLIVAGALAILTPILKILGSMSLNEIGKGLIALAGTFTVIGIAGLALGPITPVIIALSGAIALLGVGCLAVGAGLLAFSAGLAALAVSGAAGAAVLIGAVKSIIELIPYISIQIAKGIIEFAKVIATGAPILVDSIIKVVRAIIKAIVTLTPEIINGALVFMLGFLDAMAKATPKILGGIFKILTELLKQIVDFFPKIVDAGLKLIVSFVKGIGDNIGKVVKAAVDIVVNFVRAIGKETPRIVDAGFKMVIDLINGIANSMRENTPLVTDAILNLAGAMFDAMADLPRRFLEIGKNVIKGLVQGVKESAGEAVNAIGNTAKSMVDWTMQKLGIHSPSRVFKEIGVNISKGLAVGIEQSTPIPVEATKKAAKAVVKASKETFKEFEDSIDERKYYNQLSLKEELAAWQGALTNYKLTAEERKKVDREIYRVKQELREADIKAEKDAYDKSVTWIEDQKYYNKLGLTEELAAWKRVQSRYKDGSEERIKADKEVYRVQNEINKTNEEYSKKVLELEKKTMEEKTNLEKEYYDTTKQIKDKLIQDIQDVNAEYENAVKTRSDSLYSAYGLFDEVDKKDPISGEQLTKNLDDQVKEFDSWQANIQTLAKKGIDEGLIKELTEMGPKSAAQVQALSTMTDVELTTYVNLWKTKHEQAKTQALAELEGMRVATQNKIAELRTTADQELDKYNALWWSKMTELTKSSSTELATLKKEWSEKIGELRTETEDQFLKLVANVQDVMGTPDWAGVGKNIVNGIIAGIKSTAPQLNQTVTVVAKDALKSMNSTLGIHSPSTEFAKAGKYSVMGFAEGLSSFSGVITSTLGSVKDNAVTALKDTISNMTSILLNGNLDFSPVIRPVLDLTDVSAGSKAIGDILSGKGINVSGINNKLPNIKTSSSSDSHTSSQPAQGASIQFTQNNYSPKELSRIDIYRQTKNQISTLKGLVNPI